MFGASDTPGVYGQVPAASSFTQVNWGSSSLVNSGQTLYFSYASAPTGNVRAAVVAAPATPYTLTCLVQDCSTLYGGLSYPEVGLVFRESGTGKLVNCGFQFHGANYNRRIFVRQYTNPTTLSSSPLFADTHSSAARMSWLRIADNGTNIIFSLSRDGWNFVQAYSAARATGFTTAADQVGLSLVNNSGTTDTCMSVKSWVLA